VRGAPIFSYHVSQSAEALGGRPVVVPAGRCLGGGSSVNSKRCIDFNNFFGHYHGRLAMMYTRAAASDYDDWEVVHENPGWGSKQLIPLLKKVNTKHLISLSIS
jgi:alcohol oxidase